MSDAGKPTGRKCAYCQRVLKYYFPHPGFSMPDDGKTKDHIEPNCSPGRSRNKSWALACRRCNMMRSGTPIAVFSYYIATREGREINQPDYQQFCNELMLRGLGEVAT